MKKLLNYNFMKKIIFSLFTVIFIGQFGFVGQANAYVNVHGYFRNGTYVSPHVRSNPNGLKYDNYSWRPSQGLYNKTYGTRGSYWDTPTWTTDPNYYEGKSIYESLNSKSSNTYIPTYNNYSNTNKKVSIPAYAHLSSYGSDWYCDSGYKIKYDSYYNKVGCE